MHIYIQICIYFIRKKISFKSR